MSDSDITRGTDEHLRQAARVEALARRARVGRVLPDDLGPERDEPVQRLVEAVEDGTLQLLVAREALGSKVLEGPVAPDDATREQHRAAWARALLEDDRLGAEFASARRRAEAGHPGSGDEH